MHWNFLLVSDLFLTNDKNSFLTHGNFGIERETQRTTKLGDLALTNHPELFGKKLENSNITTDFSESQLELITPPFKSVKESYDYLKKLQLEVEKEIKDELLWPFSMPPRLPEEKDIPIARFDDSEEEGRYKNIYRNGLALRYGKKMQMISGLHYNFSFSDELIDFFYNEIGNNKKKTDFINEMYFSLARNFLRYRWLLIYIFGASPTVHSSYHSSKYTLEALNTIASLEKYATSLRVSEFGYSNKTHEKYKVSFNTLEEYISDIRNLLSTKSDEYVNLGIYSDDSKIQLNSNILQNEGEFYSSIRLKQITARGETQLDALEKRGIKYVEVRVLDLNPFEKLGISIDQLYFMQVFMVFCLFEENQFIDANDLEKMNINHHLVALSGRKETLQLYKKTVGKITLKNWGEEIFKKLEIIAELMDKSTNENNYKRIINKEYEKLIDKSLLPSSMIYDEMREKNEDFLNFGIRRAIINKQAD